MRTPIPIAVIVSDSIADQPARECIFTSERLDGRGCHADDLLLEEAFRLLDGEVQFLYELFVTLVGRQIETIETRVTAGEPRVLPDLLDAETLRPVAPWWQTITTMISRRTVFVVPTL